MMDPRPRHGPAQKLPRLLQIEGDGDKSHLMCEPATTAHLPSEGKGGGLGDGVGACDERARRV